MNRLIKLLSSCDLSDVTSLRVLYKNDNVYSYNGVTIVCSETHKSKPEYVKFTVQFPVEMLSLENRNRSLDASTADYCLRAFVSLIEKIDLEQEHKTGKEKFSGKIFIHEPNQKVIVRNSCFFKDDMLNITMVIRFPVHMMEKRNVVAGKLSVKIVRKELGKAIRDFVDFFDNDTCVLFNTVYRRQMEIRSLLQERKLVCFIANNSVLPRGKGEKPLGDAVPFISPTEDEIEITLSDGFVVKGMGIAEGVTVITGGGYSGKSTLLDSILSGIYNHVPGDGREYCITEERSCKIIAEDGRSVSSLDITPFIRDIPHSNTKAFSSYHASGSTSQAANIIEAVSFGCKALLIDEDRTATNFMIRDSRMKQIIQDDPIVPFTDRVRHLYNKSSVSTILIIGGTSEYLDLADNVYMMKNYTLHNYNRELMPFKQNTFEFYEREDEHEVRWKVERWVRTDSLSSFKRDAESNRIFEYMYVDNNTIHLGKETVDVSRLDTIISQQQIATIAFILRYLATRTKEPKFNLYRSVQEVFALLSEQGLDAIYSNSFDIPHDLELPALHDVMFSFSRMRLPVYVLV
ncbi:P-loop domain-containing protein [Paenibacillus sp. OV219]|uniref:P-loop domain-containing protein n=1 Tax=Paenibacillus sp. OV219 TaxID=1884377 RepID=UPI0008B35DBF|nr:P-loop domain-containing protein [Paenibacillus sp. OV219]SEN14121.1 Predicted ATPase of the ABC class [Paenibacillus sp. OV219]